METNLLPDEPTEEQLSAVRETLGLPDTAGRAEIIAEAQARIDEFQRVLAEALVPIWERITDELRGWVYYGTAELADPELTVDQSRWMPTLEDDDAVFTDWLDDVSASIRETCDGR